MTRGARRWGGWAPVLLVALAWSTVSVAAPAGAATVPGRLVLKAAAAGVAGVAGEPVVDGTCPANADFPQFAEQHQHYDARAGAGRRAVQISIDVCWVFEGALGGIDVNGTATVARHGAAEHTRAVGGVGFQGEHNSVVITMPLRHGGQLVLQACYEPPSGPLQRARIASTASTTFSCLG